MTLNKSIEFTGVYPALAVSFLPDGTLDLEAIKKNVKYLMEQGCAGMTCNGSTGEAAALTRAERVQVIQAAREAMGGKGRIIAGAGAPMTAETLNMVRDAKDAGADAALVISPIGNTTDDGIVKHYEAVAEIGIPVILYNHPAATGINISLDLFDRLIQIPNVIGMKETSGSMPLLNEILLKYEGSNLSLFCGCDDLILPVFAIGLKAVILATANVAPKQVIAIQKLVEEGKMAEAQKIYRSLAPLTRIIGDECNFPAGVKKAIELTGQTCSAPRMPILPVDQETEEAIKGAMKTAGLL